MVIFTLMKIENPPIVYGLLEGTFGARVFFNKMAGMVAIEEIAQFIPQDEIEHIKEAILNCAKLPVRGDSEELEYFVAKAPPPKYIM
jgi:hypothetical protein